MEDQSATAGSLTECIVSRMKRFGEDSQSQKGGVSGLKIGSAAHELVNDLKRYPHAFVLGCIADRRAKADIAWSVPDLIRKEAGDFKFETLEGLPEGTWSSALKKSGHPLATKMQRLLPTAIQLIRNRYGGDAARIWRRGSSGVAVTRRFLAFDGVNTKIANMAANILIRDFGIDLTEPMPDIAVDTHVLRVFERLGLLRRLEHSQLRSTKGKQQLRLQLRARELSPEWPGELDWPAWHIGSTWCHARTEPECGECHMEAVCPRLSTRNPSIGKLPGHKVRSCQVLTDAHPCRTNNFEFVEQQRDTLVWWMRSRRIPA